MYAAIHFPWEGGNLLLSGTVSNLEKKSFTFLCGVFWLNWYLRYLHNKYKLNSDKTWVISPHFTIFLDYYFTCIFDAGSSSSPSPSSRKEKKMVWIGLTKTKSTIKVNREVEFVVLSKKKIPPAKDKLMKSAYMILTFFEMSNNKLIAFKHYWLLRPILLLVDLSPSYF